MTITGAAQLAVDPATGVEFAGVPGGPFLPASRAFNVYNSGQGNLEWAEIIATCEQTGVEYAIIEQDTCQRDPLESIKISFNNLKKMGVVA